MVKILFSKNLVFLLVLLLAVAGLVIFLFLTKTTPVIDSNTADFYGTKLEFRANLTQASKIPTYPNDSEIFDTVWNSAISRLTIVFVNSSDNSLVSVEAFEIANKMSIAYNQFKDDVSVKAQEIDSYDNLTATMGYPLVALVPPSLANETLVKVENNIIYIKGMTKEDFDLATVKFLMVALEIV